MDVARWCDDQLVWCAIVECAMSRLVARVVNKWGEPEMMRKRELFSLLAHLSWRVKMEIHENAQVHWCPKSRTTHLYEWEVPPAPCISYALVQATVGVRDGINLAPNLIRYKCSAATEDMGLVTHLPVT